MERRLGCRGSAVCAGRGPCTQSSRARTRRRRLATLGSAGGAASTRVQGLAGRCRGIVQSRGGVSTGSRQAPKELRLRVGQRGVTWLFYSARDEGWDWCDVVHERERDLLGAEESPQRHSSMRLLLSLMRGLSSESHHKQEAAAM